MNQKSIEVVVHRGRYRSSQMAQKWFHSGGEGDRGGEAQVVPPPSPRKVGDSTLYHIQISNHTPS